MSEQPADIRAELTNLLSVVDGNVTITREQMEAIGDDLQALWERAHGAGDDEALTIITDVWNRAQLLVEQNASLAFQVTGMGSIATSALEGERATREVLDDIEVAIETGDESHPKLRDFAEMIREDAEKEEYEWMAEDGWTEAMAEAYEEIRGEMVERIQRLTGCGLGAASRYLSVIMGRRAQFTDYQAEMFAAFIDSFEEIVRAEMEARSGG